MTYFANGSRDANHREIVLGLEAAGRSVLEIWDLPRSNRRRKGAPDILVGWGGQMLLMEIKNPHSQYGKKVTPEQTTWHAWWKGQKVIVVRTVAEALAATGVVIDRPVDRTAFATMPANGVVNGHGHKQETGSSRPKRAHKTAANQGVDLVGRGRDEGVRLDGDDTIVDPVRPA